MATPSIPMIVQGNTYSLALPLRIYIVDDNQLVLEDYTPDPTDEVVVKLQGKRRIYTYTPTIDGNIAKIALGGYELAGHYAVIVSIVKADGNRLKSHRYDQLVIVESLDELTQQELIEGVEEDVIYLSPQSFIAGKDGRGIVSIEKTATAGLVDTYTITYTDDTTSTFEVTNGRDGEDGQPGTPGSPGQPGSDGVGIVTITKTATSGLVDTYTITLTNGNTTTFQVTNGKDGETPDMSDYYTKGDTNTLLADKAPKPFIVTITESNDTYTADKTYQEVLAAYNAGAAIYFDNQGATAQAYLFSGAFFAVMHYATTLIELVYTSDSLGSVTFNLLASGDLKTINNTSLEGSGNLSLATAAELADKADITTLVEVTATGDVSQALDSGKFYKFGEVDSLTLTFTAPSAGMGIWGGKFTASASWTALGIPASVDEAAGNDTVAGGKSYEFSMLDNVIIIKEI